MAKQPANLLDKENCQPLQLKEFFPYDHASAHIPPKEEPSIKLLSKHYSFSYIIK
jgi:hypothetical protein